MEVADKDGGVDEYGGSVVDEVGVAEGDAVDEDVDE